MQKTVNIFNDSCIATFAKYNLPMMVKAKDLDGISTIPNTQNK
jgi:hypothetical protein